MRKLGVKPYDDEPYATAYIVPIQTMIRELVEGGHAYVARRRHLLSRVKLRGLR